MTDSRGKTIDRTGERVSAHPFLTQRGLWLQQNGRLDLPGPMPLPEVAPGAFPPESKVPRAKRPRPRSPSAVPTLRRRAEEISPTDIDVLSSAGQNVRPSRRFPDPMVLRHEPLTSYFRVTPATNANQDARAAIGKLVIGLPGGRPGQYASGSAWITGPNTIATAAHNLFDSNTRQWSTWLEFYPGYDFYARQSGPVCRVVSATIPRAYLDNPLTNHDIAICRVDCNVGDLVGAEIPLRTVDDIDFFETNPVVICGYPAGSGFDFGKQLWESRGLLLFGLSGGGDDDFSPVLATNMGGGASGCPWIAQDVETGTTVAVGVTSGHARLKYDAGEPNLLSLTSPLINDRTLDRLNDDFVQHRFGG